MELLPLASGQRWQEGTPPGGESGRSTGGHLNRQRTRADDAPEGGAGRRKKANEGEPKKQEKN